MIRDIFVVNRDKKITIHDKKRSRIVIFFFVRNGLKVRDVHNCLSF